MEAKFKIGDKVRVVQSEYTNDFPTFTEYMTEQFPGNIYTISDVIYKVDYKVWIYELEGGGDYRFRESWLEPINSKGTIKHEIPVNNLLLLT